MLSIDTLIITTYGDKLQSDAWLVS